jgi:predicted DsbA family dithiol-disulfide isomerase
MAAEAAGTLGGNDAYWAMHVWLMTNYETFSDETLLQAAREMGLDTQALLSEMDSPVVSTEIAKESAFASRLGLRGVPFIFINGRHLHRWNKDGVIDAIVKEVLGEG